MLKRMLVVVLVIGLFFVLTCATMAAGPTVTINYQGGMGIGPINWSVHVVGADGKISANPVVEFKSNHDDPYKVTVEVPVERLMVYVSGQNGFHQEFEADYTWNGTDNLGVLTSQGYSWTINVGVDQPPAVAGTVPEKPAEQKPAPEALPKTGFFGNPLALLSVATGLVGASVYFWRRRLKLS